MSGARLFATGVRVTNSTAPGGGGGIAVHGGQSASIASSLIDTNTTAGPGGGILALPPPGGSAGSVAIADSTVAFNTAASGAGIASLGNAATAAERITLAYNRSGGGLAQGGVKITVKSSVLAGNTPANCGTAVPVDSGQNVESGADCGFTTGSQNADRRARRAPRAGQRHLVLPLLAGSPAIDRAVDCGTGTRDQARDGAARRARRATPARSSTSRRRPRSRRPRRGPAGAAHAHAVADRDSRARRRCPHARPSWSARSAGRSWCATGHARSSGAAAVRRSRSARRSTRARASSTLTSVPKAGGKPETAKFYDGMFKVTQSGGITTLTLNEPLAPCPSAKIGARRGQEAQDAQALGRRQGQVPDERPVQRGDHPRYQVARAGRMPLHEDPVATAS